MRQSLGCGGKALLPAHVMASAAHGNQRFDLGRCALLDVGLADIPVVNQHPPGAAQLLRQRLELRDHRRQLLLVVARLRHRVGYHQQAAGSDHGLGVVALIEPTTGDLHDARVFIGQVDLILLPYATRRRLGRTATGLLAGEFFPLGARGKFALNVLPARLPSAPRPVRPGAAAAELPSSAASQSSWHARTRARCWTDVAGRGPE